MFDNVVKLSLDFPNYAQTITTYKSRMLREHSTGKVRNYLQQKKDKATLSFFLSRVNSSKKVC